MHTCIYIYIYIYIYILYTHTYTHMFRYIRRALSAGSGPSLATRRLRSGARTATNNIT